MPRTQKTNTRVKHTSSKMLGLSAENLASWDDAIKKAKGKIARLRTAVRVFEEHKKHGEPWPGTGGVEHA